MSSSSPRLLVTAATGQLGRLVVGQLLAAVPADRVAVAVRDPAKAAAWADAGVAVHAASYDDPAALTAAFAGVDRAVLISGSEVGRRVPQHGNVIAAARAAGVKLLAYTSLLRADTTPLTLLADEHRQTERLLRESGVPWTVLRNGWYTENHAGQIPSFVEHGAVPGAAGDGRFSSAARADYAAAIAAVLTTDGHAGRTYELAGDAAYTLAELAAAVARRAGKPVVYRDLSEAQLTGLLVSVGLPEPLAVVLAQSDVGARHGGLYDDGHTLSRLIGRPTTPMAATVAAAMGG